VIFTVLAGTPPLPAPVVTVNRVVNAGHFHGDAAGARFSGHAVRRQPVPVRNVSVTLDGSAATLLYVGASQINLQVPPILGSQDLRHPGGDGGRSEQHAADRGAGIRLARHFAHGRAQPGQHREQGRERREGGKRPADLRGPAFPPAPRCRCRLRIGGT